MKIIAKHYSRTCGFTVVELLAAVAVILVLVSLIIPALNMVKESAGMARQRAQFHSIDIALEAFRADDGDYPPSGDDVLNDEAYPGAMKLAEALIGRDGFGFHPRSEFRYDGRADLNGDGDYDDPCELVYPDPPVDENLSARRGPYLELETANAVRLKDIYYLANEPDSLNGLKGEWFVLSDMFRLVKNNATGKRTGMPILYYRANTAYFNHNPLNYVLQDNIYDHFDNWRVLELEALWEGTVKQPMRLLNNPIDGPALFYKNTTNPNFPPTNNPPAPPVTGRPYRADSYILLSAGPDGLYGTPDDVFNFNKGE